MRRLRYLLLVLLALGATLAWLASREASLQWALDRVAQASQGKLRFEGVQGSLLTGIGIDRTRLAAETFELTASRGSLDFALLPLLSGDLVIRRASAEKITLHHRPGPEPLQPPQDLSLPMALRVDALEVKQLSIESGSLKLELHDLRARLESDGHQHALVLQQVQAPWGTAAAALSLHGVAPFALQGKANFRPHDTARLPPMTLAVNGNLLQFHAGLSLDAPWLGAQAKATLRPFDPNPLPVLSTDLTRFDLHALDARLPQATLAGSLRVRGEGAEHWAGELTLDNAQAGTWSEHRLPLRAARAQFSADMDQVRLSDLHLQLLRGAPLAGDASVSRDGLAARLNSTGLDLAAFHAKLSPTRLSGKLDLNIDAGSQQLSARFADQRYRYQADLVRRGQHLEVRHALVHAGRGSVAAEGHLELTQTTPFALQVQLKQLDPAALGAFPAARLNGSAKLSGTLKPKWQTSVQLALSDSDWRGQPLSGRLAALLNESRIWDSQGELLLGRNRLQIRGALGAPLDTLGLDFKLSAIEQLDARWQGTLTGQASLRGPWRYPSVELAATAARLKGPQRLRLDAVQLRAAIAPELNAPLLLDAQITGAAWGGLSADQVLLKADGSGRQHQAQLTAQGESLALRAAVQGGWQDGTQWAGRITQLETTRPHAAQLDAPAPLTISGAGLELGAARISSAGARFDLQQLSVAPGMVRTRGSLTGLPLALLALFTPDSGIDATLRLGGEWQIDAAQRLNGFLRLRRESGDLRTTSGLEAQLTEAQLELRAADNQLHLDGKLAARRGGYLRARLDTVAEKDGAGWVIPARAPLALDAEANLPLLDWLGPLIHPSLVTAGQARASARGGGTWGKPVLEGQIAGSELAISEPSSGVRLTRGTLQAHFSNDQLLLDAFQIRGKEGVLTAAGQASFDKEPRLQLSFEARQLGLLDRPNWNVNADAEGTLTADRREARLTARIGVNHALIGLPERGAPTLSPDVVVKGRKENGNKAAPTRVGLDVSVDLGKDFRVRTLEKEGSLKQAITLYQNQLDARLEGALRVRTDAAGAPSSKGTVGVADGTYTFLGKRLDIRRGTLQFDGPVGNPALDILAMNEQFDVRVGVSVTGTALNPRTHLVSEPDVPDQEKLSWLMFGRGGQSLDPSLSGKTSPGIAAFGVQVSEKVYLGYEQGTAGTASFMTLYSKLSKRLSVEARSGEASSLRLFYTFELD